MPPFMKLVYDVGSVGWYSLSAQTQARASYADALTSQRLRLCPVKQIQVLYQDTTESAHVSFAYACIDGNHTRCCYCVVYVLEHVCFLYRLLSTERTISLQLFV